MLTQQKPQTTKKTVGLNRSGGSSHFPLFFGAVGRDKQGRRWLYAPMLGPAAKDAPTFQKSWGAVEQGSTMAFEVVVDAPTNKPSLAPRWISREMHAPEPPTVANGVVCVLLSGKTSDESRGAIPMPDGVEPHAVLYALDAETGRELYSSNKLIASFTHFNA